MIVKETFDLSSTFEKRIGFDCAGFLVTEFTGIPGTVTARVQDEIAPVSLERGLLLKKTKGPHFTIENKQAQKGTLELLLASADMIDLLRLTERPNPSLVQGSVTIGTSAVQLPDNYVRPGFMVVITASQDNTDAIYVGGSDVSPTNGIRLDPGNSFAYSVQNSNEIYVISNSTNQSLEYVISLQPPQIINQLNPNTITQGSVDVGTTATQLPANYVRPGYIVVITADQDNTEPIYVGDSAVTTTNGIRLDPGNSTVYPVRNTNQIYAVAGVTGQKLTFVISLQAPHIINQLNPNDIVQGSVDVGTAATQLPANAVRPNYVVVITAKLTNTDPIYIGDSTVTTSTGIRLDPGNSIVYPVRNTNQIYAIAAVTGQSLNYIVTLQPPQTSQKLNPTAIAQGQVAVGTTATQFPAQAVPPGIAVVVCGDPGNTDYIYIGGSGVTTSNGQQLGAGSCMRLWMRNVNAIYAVSASTGQYARYIVEVNA